MREEKHKAEMERYIKELEVLRWENVNSRRGEVEVGTGPIFLCFPFSFFLAFGSLREADHYLSELCIDVLLQGNQFHFGFFDFSFFPLLSITRI